MLERRPLPAAHAVRAAASRTAAAPLAQPTTAFTFLARQVAGSASDSLSHSSSPGADRHVVQSELKTMKADELLRFDNTSGITIRAIIAVVGVLGGVFLLCIVIAALLSKTNAPRHEAFPYTQEAGQPGMYQPSASAHRPMSERKDDPQANLLDSAAPLAGNASNGTHHRSGSSGVGFPGPEAARRGPMAMQYQNSFNPGAPSPQPVVPFPGQPGTVNYNGREMTINMAGPEADQQARVAAEERLDRERARRSTVVGGPPPLANGKRASRYNRASMLGPSENRMSMSSRRSRRMSRNRLSRMSTYSSAETNGGGNLSARRKSVSSTGPGVAHMPSSRWGEEEGYTGRRSTGRRSTHGPSRASRAPPLPDNSNGHLGLPYNGPGRASLISADSVSVYDTPSMYDTGGHTNWAAAPGSQANLLDPLQAHGPNPFVMAMH